MAALKNGRAADLEPQVRPTCRRAIWWTHGEEKEHDGTPLTGLSKKIVNHIGTVGDHAKDGIEIINRFGDRRLFEATETLRLVGVKATAKVSAIGKSQARTNSTGVRATLVVSKYSSSLTPGL